MSLLSTSRLLHYLSISYLNSSYSVRMASHEKNVFEARIMYSRVKNIALHIYEQPKSANKPIVANTPRMMNAEKKIL